MDDAKRGVQTWIWQTPAAFFERGVHESRVACVKGALLVKETMLKIKINKLMDLTVSILAALCVCHE